MIVEWHTCESTRKSWPSIAMISSLKVEWHRSLLCKIQRYWHDFYACSCALVLLLVRSKQQEDGRKEGNMGKRAIGAADQNVCITSWLCDQPFCVQTISNLILDFF